MVTFLWRAAGRPEPKSQDCPFTDVVSGEYYEKAVLWAVENGITTGVTATLFRPEKIVSRAQAVTFLWRLDGEQRVDADTDFTDVASDAYYTDAVTWAVVNGITTGTTPTTFRPDNDCTRAQIVTFLSCYF